MSNKPALPLAHQISLLKQRGMLFRNDANAANILGRISYYRLKGYWWDTQTNNVNHAFSPNTYFEEIVDRYVFDQKLRIVLFNAIELIEITLRTKMIYHLSISYGGLWCLDTSLFQSTSKPGSSQTIHLDTIDELKKEFYRSKEIFIVDQLLRFPNNDPDAWKILEVASMGTISKLYKSLKHNLPEKSIISNEMGLNSHSELSSWLEAITYIRNIIAHHSRLWSRNMVKRPIENLNNPSGDWLNTPLHPANYKKPFLIISTLVYLCNQIHSGHNVKTQIIDLFNTSPNIPIYKIGFTTDWNRHPIWV
jgi:abortive infection bacteriophage resistance protein